LNLSEIRHWPFVDCCYLAPDCYDNRCYQESDVFSFGLILYELLVGQPALDKEWMKRSIARQVALHNCRTKIPKCIVPSTRRLIADCWATDPGDRLSFQQIVEQLVKMKMGVLRGAQDGFIGVLSVT
jgi:hypothetical protein